MKNTIIFGVFVILLIIGGACMSSESVKSLMPEIPGKTPQATQIQLTRTPQPTATTGYQATAFVALTAEESSRLTAQAANLAVAQYTADAMVMQLESERLANEKAAIAQREKEVSINATGTASAPVATQRAQAIMYDLAVQTKIASEPTLIYANEQARLFVKNGERDANIFYALQVAGIVLAIAFSIFLIVVTIATAIKASQPAQVQQVIIPDLSEHEFTPIPMVRDTQNPSVTNRAEINCSNEQLKELADGIINGHKTLAFNQWAGTPVYNNLKYIREFMQYHKPQMAKPLTGKGGELSIESIGEDFLLQCLSGKPPEPYKCLVPSPNE